MSSFAYVKTILVQELAQKRVDTEIANLDKLLDNYNKMANEMKANHEAKTWFVRFFCDIDQALLDYRVWTLNGRLTWPERRRDRAKGLVAMCNRSDGPLVSLSPSDAKFLGLYDERSNDV